MSIQLQMAGTGNAFAKRYYNNNALIHSNGYKLMIDFGSTAPLALYHMGCNLDQIDAFLITHLHADHVGGLEELAFKYMFTYGRKPKLIIADTLVEPLWEQSLKAGMYSEFDGYTSLEAFFDLVIYKEGQPLQINEGLIIEAVRTEHVQLKPSYSLFINHHTFYSADMKFNRELLEKAVYERKCHTIFHDCQLEGAGLVHAALNELQTLPVEIQSKIYLMHYADNMEDFRDRIKPMRFVEQHKIYEIL
jgi:hydroxyacylglutathione hydrolase